MNTILEAFQSFNQFYEKIIDNINDAGKTSSFSMREAKVLMVLYFKKECSVKMITGAIGIDKGQISRIIVKLKERNYLESRSSLDDHRFLLVSLTKKGVQQTEKMKLQLTMKMNELVEKLDEKEQQELERYMNGVRKLLAGSSV